MKAIAKQIREYLKSQEINAQVKVQGDLIIIDNLGWNWASAIAEAATGLKFVYMGDSMTRLEQ